MPSLIRARSTTRRSLFIAKHCMSFALSNYTGRPLHSLRPRGPNGRFLSPINPTASIRPSTMPNDTAQNQASGSNSVNQDAQAAVPAAMPGLDSAESHVPHTDPAQQGLQLLQQLVSGLLQVQSRPAVAPATQPSAPPAPVSTSGQPAQVPPQANDLAAHYVPPLSSNSTTGVSVSLLSSFPEVEAATLTAVIQHELRGSEIYKLDSRYRDKVYQKTLNFNGTNLELTTNDSAAKDYKSLNSIMIPLSTYFSILILHSHNTGQSHKIGNWFFSYNAHLLHLASEYEWSAVLAYHMSFFAKRRREMAQGDYSGWSRMDYDLHGEHLLDRRV